jgi:hypothetical protein
LLAVIFDLLLKGGGGYDQLIFLAVLLFIIILIIYLGFPVGESVKKYCRKENGNQANK